MIKVQIECTEEELHLINKALDFYSRVGAGQFSEIVNHPTFEKYCEEYCTPKREPIVGDSTDQGKILEIKKGKALIAGSVKDGKWCKDHEWKPLSKVKLSVNYSMFHEKRDRFHKLLCEARDIFIGKDHGTHGNWGIFNPALDDSCRTAFHLHQVIRHEFWKLKNEKHETSTTISAHPADCCQIAGIKVPEFKVKLNDEERPNTKRNRKQDT